MDSQDVNDTCKSSLQISRGILAHDKIIQMHTIHESCYVVRKQPHNRNRMAKKINKKAVQFIKVIKHN